MTSQGGEPDIGTSEKRKDAEWPRCYGDNMSFVMSLAALMNLKADLVITLNQ